MNRILLFIAIFFHSVLLQAQIKGDWQIGIHTNVMAFNATANNGIYLRAANTDEGAVIKSHAYQWSVGSSFERKINQGLFLSSGIYYTQMQTSTFSREGIGRSSFYALINQNDNALVYASINRIYTPRNYLSIPLEVRYEPWHTKHVAFFIKGSLINHFAIGSSTTFIRMSDSSIYAGNKSLPEHYQNNRDWIFNGYTAIGLRIGMLKYINGRIELGIPVPFTNNVGVYKLRAGAMIGGTLYYPLGKK